MVEQTLLNVSDSTKKFLNRTEMGVKSRSDTAGVHGVLTENK